SSEGLAEKIRTFIKRIVWVLESSPKIGLGIILLLVGFSIVSVIAGHGVSFAEQNDADDIAGHISYRKVVGVFYRWIVNPAHDTNISAGYWSNAKLRPLDGYYDSSSARLVRDISIMRKVGVKTIIFDVFTMGGLLVSQITDIIEEENMSILMYFNLSLVLEDPLIPTFSYFPEQNISDLFFEFSPRNIMLIKSQILALLSELEGSNSLVRYDNRTAIVVSGLQRFLPGWKEESRRYLAAALVEMIESEYNVDNKTITMNIINNLTGWNASTVDDLIYDYYPQTLYDFISNESCKIWLEAFKYAWLRDMTEIFRNSVIGTYVISGYEILPISIVSLDMIRKVSDDVFTCPNRYSVSDGKLYVSLQQDMIDRYNSNIIITVPNFVTNYTKILVNNSQMYNNTWRLAIDRNVSFVFIYGWNLYGTGSVIEPTVEFEYYTLNLTRSYVKEYIERGKISDESKHNDCWLARKNIVCYVSMEIKSLDRLD
ncbi:MAG: hypothetical protein Q6363_009230, partial [Candidatus Njordarchaeota archaeon]